MPVRVLVTEGTRADRKETVHLIKGISAETLLVDRGHDTNYTLTYATSAGMQTVIPPQKDRKEQRGYDEYLCKLRHLAESCFLVLKRWIETAARYAKTSDAFITVVHVRSTLGSTGNSAGPHLHLVLYYHGSPGENGMNYAEMAWPQYRR